MHVEEYPSSRRDPVSVFHNPSQTVRDYSTSRAPYEDMASTDSLYDSLQDLGKSHCPDLGRDEMDGCSM